MPEPRLHQEFCACTLGGIVVSNGEEKRILLHKFVVIFDIFMLIVSKTNKNYDMYERPFPDIWLFEYIWWYFVVWQLMICNYFMGEWAADSDERSLSSSQSKMFVNKIYHSSYNRCPFIKTSQSIKLAPVCLLSWIVFWLVKSLFLPLQSSSELTNQNFYSKSHVTIQFTFRTLADTNVILMLLMVYKINFMSCLRYRWRVYFKSVIFIASWWVSCCCAMHMFLICSWIFLCERIMIKV